MQQRVTVASPYSFSVCQPALCLINLEALRCGRKQASAASFSICQPALYIVLQELLRGGQKLEPTFSDSVCQPVLCLVFFGSWVVEELRKTAQAAHVLQNASVPKWHLIVSRVITTASRAGIFLHQTVSRLDGRIVVARSAFFSCRYGEVNATETCLAA